MSSAFKPIRVVIADHHPVSRQDLCKSLESAPDFHVVGLASDGPSVVQLVSREKPDVVLVDFALACKCQLKELNESLTKLDVVVRIIITVGSIEKTHLVGAFSLGAHSVVRKRSAPNELHKSIRGAVAGRYTLESESIGVLVEAFRESLNVANGTKSPKDYGLTRRELDIIAKIASGRSNKEVGEDFAISERTVKHHLTNIFGKVGVSNRVQLALLAVNQHFMTSPSPSLTLQSAGDDET